MFSFSGLAEKMVGVQPTESASQRREKSFVLSQLPSLPDSDAEGEISSVIAIRKVSEPRPMHDADSTPVAGVDAAVNAILEATATEPQPEQSAPMPEPEPQPAETPVVSTAAPAEPPKPVEPPKPAEPPAARKFGLTKMKSFFASAAEDAFGGPDMATDAAEENSSTASPQPQPSSLIPCGYGIYAVTGDEYTPLGRILTEYEKKRKNGGVIVPVADYLRILDLEVLKMVSDEAGKVVVARNERGEVIAAGNDIARTIRAEFYQDLHRFVIAMQSQQQPTATPVAPTAAEETKPEQPAPMPEPEPQPTETPVVSTPAPAEPPKPAEKSTQDPKSRPTHRSLRNLEVTPSRPPKKKAPKPVESPKPAEQPESVATPPAPPAKPSILVGKIRL